MFTSYKPKKFRNNNGCCICGTKSSSSRFTDSKKYESDFAKCFRIVEKRSGDICNACVLLVKRFRKLPNDTDRHWNHVVDARTGPGSKSAMKNKNKPCQSTQKNKSSLQPKANVISKPTRSVTPEVLSGSSKSDKRSLSSRHLSDSDDSDDMDNGKVKYKKICTKKKKALDPEFNSCFRSSYWKKTKVCCGIIFEGMYGEVMVDTRFFKPCKPHHVKLSQEKEKAKANLTQSPVATASNSSSSKASADETYTSSTSDDSNPSTSDIARNDAGFSEVRKIADLIACG